MSACTAACAPSGAPLARGICSASFSMWHRRSTHVAVYRTRSWSPARQRLRRQVRQRQRVGFGQRQCAVRQVDPAHGRADDAAQHLPVQHPGAADVVRGAGLGGGASRRARRRRGSDGGDESADLDAGHRVHRAGRLPVLRFHQADAAVAVPRRHRGDRRAADRDHQQGVHRIAPAAVVQEHRLSRCAVGAVADGRGGDREAAGRAVPRPRQADRGECAGTAHGARLRAGQPGLPDRPDVAARRCGR